MHKSAVAGEPSFFNIFTDTCYVPKRSGGARFTTVGVRSGMATRKTAPKGRKPRMGLRSQVKAGTEEDVAWDSMETTEDEEIAASLPEASSKCAVQHSPIPSIQVLHLVKEW